MKAIAMTVIAAFCAVLSFGQTTLPATYLDVRPTYEFNTENEQASVVKTHRAEQASEKLAYHDYSTGECGKYHKMKIAGIILSAVGGGMIVTGATLVAIDNQQTYMNGENYYNGYHPLRNGGGAMMGLGFVSAGAGIPLAIVGSVKGRRYCGGAGIPSERSYLELNSNSNGYGLALKF